ncbi:hypothetical protein GLOIN_2v1769868 [Rhizophagus irregularis DAOM 181602=DAOM 197198]|nr:hypothetical protein GLOIN_2v1769868 [Rhizophagus irregularis DAOM 181602=DAOM 197198]
MDPFLDEVNKKRVSDEIRQKKREEKLAKVEFIFPEKDKQRAVTKVIVDDSISSVSSQRESDTSTNCSNIIDEPGSNSLDVCLEKTIRSCESLAVEMGTPTFSLLYEKLCNAVILADRVKKLSFVTVNLGKLLSIEVKAQLLAGTSDALLWKRIEQTKKLYTLFNAIDNIPFDYSIHMELQLCKLSSQSNKKNSDLLHITSSDTPTESQVSNESAPKKFDTKVEVIPPTYFSTQ